MIKELLTVVYIVLFGLVGLNQNLITNGGFEKFQKCPYDLGSFTPEGWINSSKGTSPDLFSKCAHEKVKSHPNWIFTEPASGKSFAGIVIYAHKIDYRESITNTFSEPMKEGKTYTLTFKISIPYISRWRNDNIHLYFTEKPLFQIGDKFINTEKPILFSIKDAPMNGKWKEYIFKYTAKGGEQHLSIGNYNNHDDTKVEKIDERNTKLHRKEYNHSYIAIDDVSILTKKEVKNTKKEPEKPKEINKEEVRSFTLRNIKFELNAATINDKNIPELDTIAKIMKDKPNLKAVITGHTDNQGDVDYNKKLSKKRAHSVAKILMQKGVKEERIETIGKGDENPLQSNDTEKGRAQNRRVEITIE